ncbi:MAG: DUF3592 domain-containing protein [Opitutales bacterium]|nr:DUF3592 domain-containing protein [Opitutales bacterium]
MKRFRADYFAAKTKTERVLEAVSGIFHSIVMLVFGGIWTGMTSSIFFPLIFSEKNSEAGWVPVLFVGGFFCIGLGMLGYALFRLGSIIRTIFTAPPVGSVPETSQTNVPAGTPDSANPFRSATDGDADSDANSDVPETLGSKIFLAIFGLVFFCAGVTVSTIGVKKYLDEETAAKTWISAPCKIVSATLERESGSKGGTTYSPKIVYEFSVGEKTYRGNDIFISLNSSSSNYDKEKRRLERYRKEKTCWFNPENPSENALMKPTGGFSLRKIVLAIFGIPFFLVGGGIFVGGVFGNYFKKKKKVPERPIGALRSEMDGSSPLTGVLAVFGFATVWNLIVFIVGAGFFTDGFPGAFPAAVIGFFALIGIGLIFLALWTCLRIFNPQYLLVLSPSGTPVPGGNVQLSWRVLRGDPVKVQALKLEFVRLGNVTGTRANGSEERKVEEIIPVYETMSRSEIAAGTAEFFVPANLVSGKWVFRLSGKTAFPRPDVEADFFVS